MSLLPPEALEKLTCSNCLQYPSALPVKVYPNKSVKCGRCCRDGDGGTVSVLYELLARKCKFPCINRFEGCREQLSIDEALEHEQNFCSAMGTKCPFCSTNLDSTCHLLLHLRKEHKSAGLEKPAFWIDLSLWDQQEIFFYCEDDLLINVGYKYTMTKNELMLYLNINGKIHRNQTNLNHKFKLYFWQNETPFETANIASVHSDLSDARGFKVDLTNHKNSKNIIFCMFELWDSTDTLNIANIPQTIDGAASEAILRFEFHRFNMLRPNFMYYSDFDYWVGKRLWMVAIEISSDNLGIYLCQGLKSCQEGPCKIIADVALISSKNEELNVVHNMTKNNFKISAGWKNFLNLNVLRDGQNGFMTDNCIKIEVSIKVLPPEVDKDEEKNDCPNCR
ncbi:unnamed protein product [Ceutorhynchus assimilis]|uniref:C2H2-type domain-containing protein n=1 Tax=Ceutorhynchus assimilis TaxID=467358 RepID=A0A9N9QRD5_9CUCU|nr:unnamed protein product [Ceutorhynchus assimilis]